MGPSRPTPPVPTVVLKRAQGLGFTVAEVEKIERVRRAAMALTQGWIIAVRDEYANDTERQQAAQSARAILATLEAEFTPPVP